MMPTMKCHFLIYIVVVCVPFKVEPYRFVWCGYNVRANQTSEIVWQRHSSAGESAAAFNVHVEEYRCIRSNAKASPTSGR